MSGRSSESLDDGTIGKVLDYYRRDGISRPPQQIKRMLY